MPFSEIMPFTVRKVLKNTSNCYEPQKHGGTSLAGQMPARVPRRMVRFLHGHHMEERDAPAFQREPPPCYPTISSLCTMREAIGFVRSAELPDGRFVTFSFDDGFRDNLRLHRSHPG